MKHFIFALLILLAIFHQDFWLWNDASVVTGFVPVGLAYHLGVSVAAALLWALAVKFCWPRDVDVPEEPAAIDAGAARGSKP